MPYFEESIKENLPYPFVFYPYHFFPKDDFIIKFSKHRRGDRCICSCMKSAVSTYHNFFPKDLNPIFKPKLCHRCNMRVPIQFSGNYYEYNIFERYFSYYIYIQYLDYGVFPKRKYNQGVNPKLKFDKRIVNKVRQDFGFKSVGSTAVNERLLYLVVRDILSNYEVIFHARIPELKGLELDIYIPNKQLAFEYQGQQHYKAVKHWGGEQGLSDLKRRDLKKKRLCNKSNITLIKIRYSTHIDHPLVYSLLNKHNIEL